MKKLLTLFTLLLFGTPLCASNFNFAPLNNWPPPPPQKVESGNNVVRPSLSGKKKRRKKASRRVNLAAFKQSINPKPIIDPVKSLPVIKPQPIIHPIVKPQPIIHPIVKPQPPKRKLKKKRTNNAAQSVQRHRRRMQLK